jgi:23S rRNA pseudouridine2605 synthase/16S rRNA pseudouridine516 synthase
MERLQKFLARAGIASRRGAEKLIEEGRVTVNGTRITRLGHKIDPVKDSVKVNGKRAFIKTAKPVYLMLHKPRGCVTTVSDPEGRPTVMDLMRGVRGRIYPIGRLDFNSEGLLLLTDDGHLAQGLMHPGKQVPKTYRVKVKGIPSERDLSRLEAGIELDKRRFLPAKVRVIRSGRNTWLDVEVTEGRKHLIRKMFSHIGHQVLKLRRTAYGGVPLGKLAPGEYRHLTNGEIRILRQAAGVAEDSPTGTRKRPKRS